MSAETEYYKAMLRQEIERGNFWITRASKALTHGILMGLILGIGIGFILGQLVR